MQAQSIATKVCRRDAWAYRALLLERATVSLFVAMISKLQFGGLNHGLAVGLNSPCRGLFLVAYQPESGLVTLAASISQFGPGADLTWSANCGPRYSKRPKGAHQGSAW